MHRVSQDTHGLAGCSHDVSVLADVVRIELLLVRQGLEVFANLEAHDGWRSIGKVLGELLSAHHGEEPVYRRTLWYSKPAMSKTGDQANVSQQRGATCNEED